MRHTAIIALVGIAGLAALAAPVHAEMPPPEISPYLQGTHRLGVNGSLLEPGSDSWSVGFGLQYGYVLLKNFELGADVSFQFGEAPFAAILGPTARYYIPFSPDVHLYLGAFYRHWFLSGLDDADSVGGRLGIVLRQEPTFLSLGAAYEHVVSTCHAKHCGTLYPEVSVSLLF